MFGRLFYRFLIFGLLALFVGRALRSFFGGIRAGFSSPNAGPSGPSRRETRVEKGQMMARDPVCGTFVVPATALSGRSRTGSAVYFCSEKCRQSYQASS